MFSNIGVPGLILIIVMLVILLAIPITLVLLIISFKKRNNRLKRIEEKLDNALFDKGK
jgi:hypothetical protein